MRQEGVYAEVGFASPKWNIVDSVIFVEASSAYKSIESREQRLLPGSN